MNSADPDEMQSYAEFHLGLHFLPIYLLTHKRVKQYSAYCEKLIFLKDQNMKKYHPLLNYQEMFYQFHDTLSHIAYMRTAKALAGLLKTPELLLLTPSMDIEKDSGQK